MTRSRLLLATLVLLARPAEAQYFGQNKVQYRHLDFAVLETEHFDIYFYPDEREAAVDAARMAERAYARLSRVLNHRYRERQPIILFASHSEFQQNNVTDIGEATGGVTEAFRHRVMLPFTGSYADFDHVLQHELVHQFQYDVFARGRIGGGIQRLIAVQPPLWLMEGMAEYLSTGPVSPLTAMWLRNAALEGHLPTVEELTRDPSIFPYRYGHALLAYIGERWGDEVIGEVLHGVSTSGVERGLRRALGISLEQLSAEWHYAVRRAYLPEIADREAPHEVGRPVLTRQRTGALLHLSPALSPDGRRVAYFSEGGSFFVDLYVADTETGRARTRLVKSAFSADFENLRYLHSAGAWSPDGRYFAIATQSEGRDDLVVLDLERRREHRRIDVPLHGVSTPAWSPDGRELVFTGYDGGLSDLYLVRADGTGLRRLTDDRYADLQPVWSPDGRTIAFVTDRGPGTDLETLRFGGMRIALLDLETGRIALPDGMEGRNINPQWAPDGRSVAFLSDRTGVPNVFLYDLDDAQTYQLTDVFTGIAGLTELSPALSWARDADRLAFSYYQGPDFSFAVYVMDNPRARKGTPYAPTTRRTVAYAPPPADEADSLADPTPPLPSELPRATASVYRYAGAFRAAGTTPAPEPEGERPISVRDLLDSATLALPDTAEFSVRRYTGKLFPDYIAQPTVGYTRDNFGRGIFGGTAIALSDMLGNRRMLLAGQVNGRLDEAQILAAYGNLGHRTNWTVGLQQYPIFFFTGSRTGIDTAGRGVSVFTLDRFLIRQAFFDAARPFNRFRRLEFGLRAANIGRARQEFTRFFDPSSGASLDTDLETVGLGHTNYFQPSVAMVFDNAVSLYVGPIMGRRARFEYAPAFGDWLFHQALADYRRYDRLGGPFVFATRALFFGRFGRDDDQFPIFLGDPSLLRGYTAGSIRRNECGGNITRAGGCPALEQLIGHRLGVFNAELRFPLFRDFGLGFLPIWFPPIEGAVFFDAGIAWRSGDEVVFAREAGDSPTLVRQPLTSWGVSARINMLGLLILRFDYAKPLSRDEIGAYWTVSLGPTY